MKKSTVISSLTRFERLKTVLKKRFFLRFHMVLILIGVFSSGLIFSKLLLEAGLRSMLIRYPIVLVLSYLMFFILIKIWLLYIQRTSSSNLSDDGLCNPVFIPGGCSTQVGSTGDLIGQGGGEFGGGGASGDFSDSSIAGDTPAGTGNVVSAAVVTQSGESSCLPDAPDIDLDKGGIVLIALGLLLALILGAGFYLIYAAPAILSDAALQVIMASSLYKASKKMDDPDWVGSIFKATWIPFTIMAVLTIAVACVATHYCPDATKLSDAVRSLTEHR
jgi:hypothetical protein